MPPHTTQHWEQGPVELLLTKCTSPKKQHVITAWINTAVEIFIPIQPVSRSISSHLSSGPMACLSTKALTNINVSLCSSWKPKLGGSQEPWRAHLTAGLHDSHAQLHCPKGSQTLTWAWPPGLAQLKDSTELQFNHFHLLHKSEKHPRLLAAPRTHKELLGYLWIYLAKCPIQAEAVA